MKKIYEARDKEQGKGQGTRNKKQGTNSQVSNKEIQIPFLKFQIVA